MFTLLRLEYLEQIIATIQMVGFDSEKQIDLKNILLHKYDDSEIFYKFKFVSSFSPQDTRATFYESHPDLLLIANACENGLSFCTMIRKSENHRHIGIIFWWDAKDKNTPLQCFRAGADDVILPSMSDQEFMARVVATLRLKFLADELRRANHMLEKLSVTDDLTGLFNMRYFYKYLAEKYHDHQRSSTGFGLVMLDLDHFKSINDNANHLVGSYVLSQLGKMLKWSQVYKGPVCFARYGGDEFIILSSDTCYEDLMRATEKLRALLEQTRIHKDDFAFQITASFGVCFTQAEFIGDMNEAMKCADFMLYQSKAKGRNTVSGAVLDNTVDFDHIRRAHLGYGDTSSKNHNISRFDQLQLFK